MMGAIIAGTTPELKNSWMATPNLLAVAVFFVVGYEKALKWPGRRIF
jgi:hypothetical protein